MDIYKYIRIYILTIVLFTTFKYSMNCHNPCKIMIVFLEKYTKLYPHLTWQAGLNLFNPICMDFRISPWSQWKSFFMAIALNTKRFATESWDYYLWPAGVSTVYPYQAISHKLALQWILSHSIMYSAAIGHQSDIVAGPDMITPYYRELNKVFWFEQR